MMKVNYDPLRKYPQADRKSLTEACGLIPYWVIEWHVCKATCARIGEPFTKTLKAYLDERYGFGLYEMGKNSKIDDDGTYHYPEDPDLWPYMSIELDIGIFYQYPYAITAIPTTDGHFVTRMD